MVEPKHEPASKDATAKLSDDATPASCAKLPDSEQIAEHSGEAQQPSSRSLHEAAERLSLNVPAECFAGLEAYCAALWEWNTKINLTRHTDYDLFARRDLLDTVKLAEHLQPNHEILDIGTGGGVPGVVLGILRPDLTISVCDSVTKKSKVVRDIVRRLDLPITVYASRAQQVLEDMRFHSLVTRAAGSISQLLNWVNEHWTSFDNLLAIKGPRWVAERGEARRQGLLNGIELRRVDAYKMPGTKAESVILQFSKNRS